MFIDESRFKHWTGEELKGMITAAGVDQTILGSDLGQINNPTPVTGFRAVIRLCIEQGYDDDQIRKLVGGNAARLLGLNERRQGV
jgi:microsomal dipeptidase-like Zn-dependent dipeptidase